MAGARGLLINITGGEDMTLFEVDQAANRIREEVDEEANIIFGSAIDESLTGKVRVSVVATGIDTPASRPNERPHLVAVGGNGGGSEPASAVGQHTAPQVAAMGGAPATIGNLAVAQHPQSYPQQVGAQPAVLRAPPAPPPPPARAPQPGVRVQAPYTLQPAAPRQPPPAPGAPPAYQPAQAPDGEPPTGYEQGNYGEPPAARPQARPPQPPAQRGAVRPTEPRIPGRSASLFAEPPAAAPAPRKSLFGIVTGAIRGQPAEPPPPQRTEPTQHELRGESARAHVRQTSGEENAIDIPAFLRRQSS